MNVAEYWAQVRRLEEILPETVVITSWEGEPVRAGRREAAEAIVSGRMRMGTREEGDTLRHRDEIGAAMSQARSVAGRQGYQVRIQRVGEK